MSTPLAPTALFGFRVGGVQDFIDSARTTEDFWASSYLISHLTRQVAKALTTEFGEACMIFPSGITPHASDLRIARFPNGILAEVPLKRAAALGHEMEYVFHGAWREAMEAVRTVLAPTIALVSQPAQRTWERQARRRTFETFWAWTPFDGEYPVAYQRLSALLEACKLLRDFDFAGDAEPNTKCTQCGKLQALQNFEGFSEKGSKEYWEKLADAKNSGLKFRFRATERLCAICVTCRMASRSAAFGGDPDDWHRAQPSTSSIAVTPFLRVVFGSAVELDDEVVQFVRDLKAVLSELEVEPLAESPYRGVLPDDWDTIPHWHDLQRFDGDWFFATSYENASLERELKKTVSPSKLNAARKSLNAIYDAAKMKPSAYLALVAMDGDEVGEWISGRKTPGATPTIESHRRLSQALAKVGPAAQHVIEEKLMGRLIYAGGDDLLFLVPVANLAGGIHDVLQAVRSAMGEEYKEFRFSAAALAMPHHDSLSGSIREAESLLKQEAKDAYDRDCVVLSARRQSGQRTFAAMKSRQCAAFQRVVSAMSLEGESGGLSPRMAGQFSMLAAGMDGHGDDAAIEEMALFLMGRHTRDHTREASLDLRNSLIALTDSATAMATAQSGKVPPPSQQLEHTLLTARFLERSETGR